MLPGQEFGISTGKRPIAVPAEGTYAAVRHARVHPLAGIGAQIQSHGEMIRMLGLIFGPESIVPHYPTTPRIGVPRHVRCQGATVSSIPRAHLSQAFSPVRVSDRNTWVPARSHVY